MTHPDRKPLAGNGQQVAPPAPDVSALVAALESARNLIAQLLRQPVFDKPDYGMRPLRDGLPYHFERWALEHVTVGGDPLPVAATPPAPPQEEGERLCKRTLEKAAECAAALRASGRGREPTQEQIVTAIRALAEG